MKNIITKKRLIKNITASNQNNSQTIGDILWQEHDAINDMAINSAYKYIENLYEYLRNQIETQINKYQQNHLAHELQTIVTTYFDTDSEPVGIRENLPNKIYDYLRNKYNNLSITELQHKPFFFARQSIGEYCEEVEWLYQTTIDHYYYKMIKQFNELILYIQELAKTEPKQHNTEIVKTNIQNIISKLNNIVIHQ